MIHAPLAKKSPQRRDVNSAGSRFALL